MSFSYKKIDEYVIDYTCKDACVKFANVKSVTREMFARGRWTLPQEQTVCTELKCRSGEGTFYNRHVCNEAPQASHDKRACPPGWHQNCSHGFRQVHASERSFACIFKTVHISWGQRSVDAITGLHRSPKEALSKSEFWPENTQVDFEIDHPPPADSPPGDSLITVKKETVTLKRVSKMKKSETCSYLSLT